MQNVDCGGILWRAARATFKTFTWYSTTFSVIVGLHVDLPKSKSRISNQVTAAKLGYVQL